MRRLLVMSIIPGLLTLGCADQSSNQSPNTSTSKPIVQKADESTKRLDDSKKSYLDGIKALQSKNYSLAIELFVKVVTEDKNYSDAQAKLTLAKNEKAKLVLADAKKLYQAGQYYNALTRCDDALLYNPNFPEAQQLKSKAKSKYDAVQKQKAAQEAAAARKAVKENMNVYEGDGDVMIAVGSAKLKRSTDLHVAKGNGTFVYVSVSVKNYGDSIVHANPNDFTLSTPEGQTVSHDTDTYGLSNYFDAVDLRPGNETNGWLIFYTVKSNDYILNYQGWSGTATKKIGI